MRRVVTSVEAQKRWRALAEGTQHPLIGHHGQRAATGAGKPEVNKLHKLSWQFTAQRNIQVSAPERELPLGFASSSL